MTPYLFIVGFALSVAAYTANFAGNFDDTAPPCAPRCWESSLYVTTCARDQACLCSDDEFQSVVLQCVYSQCQAASFGSALHHTLEACSGAASITLDDFPPLIRHQGLRRRQYEDSSNHNALHSASVLRSAHHSSQLRSTTAAVTVHSRPTYSFSQRPLRTSVGVAPFATGLARQASIVSTNVSSAISTAYQSGKLR